MAHLSKLLALLLLLALLPQSALAICGKECKQAKTYCKNWMKKNPGQTCGHVRGLSCTGKSWKKIKQVNALWAACKLVKGEKDMKRAQARCAEFKKYWGGKCQVISPACKPGWVKLGKYGKFRACRPIEVDANMRYNAYKAFMRKFEGKAKYRMHPVLRAHVKKFYGFDPGKVLWGYAANTPSTCITDCDKIYCNKQSIIDWIRAPHAWDNPRIVFHELQHVEQCRQRGGRKNYAKLWFGNLPRGFFGALDPKVKDKFKNKVHDAMPMEKDAESRGLKVRDAWRKGWWHKLAYCRVYKSDRKTIVATTAQPQSRLNCAPKYNLGGYRLLKNLARNAAKKHGYGTYYFAFGKPHQANNGFWLGKGTFGTKPPRAGKKTKRMSN